MLTSSQCYFKSRLDVPWNPDRNGKSHQVVTWFHWLLNMRIRFVSNTISDENLSLTSLDEICRFSLSVSPLDDSRPSVVWGRSCLFSHRDRTSFQQPLCYVVGDIRWGTWWTYVNEIYYLKILLIRSFFQTKEKDPFTDSPHNHSVWRQRW